MSRGNKTYLREAESAILFCDYVGAKNAFTGEHLNHREQKSAGDMWLFITNATQYTYVCTNRFADDIGIELIEDDRETQDGIDITVCRMLEIDVWCAVLWLCKSDHRPHSREDAFGMSEDVKATASIAHWIRAATFSTTEEGIKYNVEIAESWADSKLDNSPWGSDVIAFIKNSIKQKKYVMDARRNECINREKANSLKQNSIHNIIKLKRAMGVA